MRDMCLGDFGVVLERQNAVPRDIPICRASRRGMTTGLRPLRQVAQNDLTKRSATPDSTQSAIARASYALTVIIDVSPPFELSAFDQRNSAPSSYIRYTIRCTTWRPLARVATARSNTFCAPSRSSSGRGASAAPKSAVADFGIQYASRKEPQTMMAMLVRAGLPSRIAAMIVITQTRPSFVNGTEMNQWLRSDEMAAWTDQSNWPTAETTDLWKRFRTEALAGSIQKWSSQEWRMNAAIAQHVNPAIPGRINVDALTGQISVTTPDYRHIIGIRGRLRQFVPSLLHVEFAADRQSARIVRLGRARARWDLPA